MKKRWISLLMAMVLVLSAAAPAHAAWYDAAVAYVTQNGLMDQVGGAFAPDQKMTREQVAEVIYRDARQRGNLTTQGGSSLSEAPDYATISPDRLTAVSFCFYAGIMTGNSDRTMKPLATITREEFACVLERYCQWIKLKTAVDPTTVSLDTFTDAKDIGTWAQESLKFCVAGELLQGNSDGTFAPRAQVSRAEMAQIVYNLSLRQPVAA